VSARYLAATKVQTGLKAFLGELTGVLERHREIQLATERRAELLGLSASTIDRKT